MDENDTHCKRIRTYYVKIDNIGNIPEEMKGTKAIDAETPIELLEKVKQYYKFKQTLNIQLWSSSIYKGIRLDTLNIIPLEYEFIWVRVA